MLFKQQVQGQSYPLSHANVTLNNGESETLLNRDVPVVNDSSSGSRVALSLDHCVPVPEFDA